MWPWEIKAAIRYCNDVVSIMQFLDSLRGHDEQALTKTLQTKFALESEPPLLAGPYNSNCNLVLMLNRVDPMLSLMKGELLITLYGIEAAAGFTLYVNGLMKNPKAKECTFSVEVIPQHLFRVPGPTRLAKNLATMLFMDHNLDIIYIGESNHITLNKSGSPQRVTV